MKGSVKSAPGPPGLEKEVPPGPAGAISRRFPPLLLSLMISCCTGLIHVLYKCALINKTSRKEKKLLFFEEHVRTYPRGKKELNDKKMNVYFTIFIPSSFSSF
jgi:hypothetical protein